MFKSIENIYLERESEMPIGKGVNVQKAFNSPTFPKLLRASFLNLGNLCRVAPASSPNRPLHLRNGPFRAMAYIWNPQKKG